MPETQKLEHLKKLATLMRYHILTMTTQAGSGHPTSSLSATSNLFITSPDAQCSGSPRSFTSLLR